MNAVNKETISETVAEIRTVSRRLYTNTNAAV